MAIGTLALCYNNIEVFRGVVKMRRGNKNVLEKFLFFKCMRIRQYSSRVFGSVDFKRFDWMCWPFNLSVTFDCFCCLEMIIW